MIPTNKLDEFIKRAHVFLGGSGTGSHPYPVDIIRAARTYNDYVISEEEMVKKYCVYDHKASIMRGNKEYLSDFLNYGAMKRYRDYTKLIPKSFVEFPIIEVITMLSTIMPEKVKVQNYVHAKDLGVLASYFKGYDFLGIAEDTKDSSGLIMCYSGDYYEYCHTLPKEKVIERYRYWMNFKSDKIQLSNNGYGAPWTFVDYFERQMLSYVEVISKIQAHRFYIIGDGVGAASMICSALGKEYYSYEPNMIGEEARMLKIITSDEPNENIIDEETVVLAFNVEEYVVLDHYKKLVVITEGRVPIPNAYMAEGTWGRLWSRNVDIPNIILMRDHGTKGLGMVENKKLVAYDTKSYFLGSQVSDNVITEDEYIERGEPEGYMAISASDRAGVLNIDTRNDPGNMRNAKYKDRKLYGDVFFIYFGEDFEYTIENKFGRARFFPYRDSRILHDYITQNEFIIGYTRKPDAIRWIVIDDQRIRVFYIQSVRFKNKEFGIFRKEVDMFGATHIINGMSVGD